MELILAPMAGVTDYAFRKLCKEQGADFLYTEMVSAKALFYKDKKTKLLLKTDDSEKPIAAQIFGHEPDIMAYGAKVVEQMGFCGVDINAGCPAPKIVKNGEGSALMRTPGLLAEVVCAVKQAVSVPVSVKLRAGWDGDSMNVIECARLCQEAGADRVAVHGRTRELFYSGKADWNMIASVKQALSIPVIANGDIFDWADALAVLEQTHADALMIGRGALGNPWVFCRIRAALNGEQAIPCPTTENKLTMAKRHLDLLIEQKGEYIGVREARKHIGWYVKGIRNASGIKERVNRAKTREEMLAVLAGD